jgi:hypothetical protein
MQPENYDFEAELLDTAFLVVMTGPIRRSEIVQGWAEIERIMADCWPRITGHQVTAAEFGRHFGSLKEIARWCWDDEGLPIRFMAGSAYGDMTFLPLPPDFAVPAQDRFIPVHHAA